MRQAGIALDGFLLLTAAVLRTVVVAGAADLRSDSSSKMSMCPVDFDGDLVVLVAPEVFTEDLTGTVVDGASMTEVFGGARVVEAPLPEIDFPEVALAPEEVVCGASDEDFLVVKTFT